MWGKVGKVGSYVRDNVPVGEDIIGILYDELKERYPNQSWCNKDDFKIWKAGIVANSGAEFTINGSDVFRMTASKTLQLSAEDECIYELIFLNDTPINMRFSW